MSEPTEQELDEIRRDIFVKRIKDLRGWLLESFTEASDTDLIELSNLAICRSKPHTLMYIGEVVMKMVRDHCTPSDEEVYDEWSTRPILFRPITDKHHGAEANE